MITEKDLQEAIAECQGQRNPNAQTCIKLAAYYTILNNMGKDFNSERELESYPPYQNYSYAAPDESTIDYESDTEIGKLIDGKNLNEFLSFIDEFFSQLLKTYNPDLYNYAIRKLKE